MKIVGLHIGVRSLAGHTRCFLGLMDWLKGEGHNVSIYDRFRGKTTATVQGITFTQQLNSEQIHFKINYVRDYFPLKHLTFRDIHFDDVPAFYAGFGYPPMSEALMQKLDEADLIVTDAEHLVQLPTTVRSEFYNTKDGSRTVDYAWRWSKKFIMYTHFPNTGLGPNPNPDYQPARILCNSEFTKKAIAEKWGWPDARVCYPPCYTEFFSAETPMKDRRYDLIFYSRLAKDKFEQFDEIRKAFPFKRIVVVGSNYGLADELRRKHIEVVENATFQQVAWYLSQSKMYVHLKGIDPGTKNEGEHFGMSIQDAVASGCLAFIPSTPSGSHEIPTVRIYDGVDDLIRQIKSVDIELLEQGREERRKAIEVNDPKNREEELKSAFSL